MYISGEIPVEDNKGSEKLSESSMVVLESRINEEIAESIPQINTP
jgi:hypothetical protein